MIIFNLKNSRLTLLFILCCLAFSAASLVYDQVAYIYIFSNFLVISFILVCAILVGHFEFQLRFLDVIFSIFYLLLAGSSLLSGALAGGFLVVTSTLVFLFARSLSANASQVVLFSFFCTNFILAIIGYIIFLSDGGGGRFELFGLAPNAAAVLFCLMILTVIFFASPANKNGSEILVELLNLSVLVVLVFFVYQTGSRKALIFGLIATLFYFVRLGMLWSTIVLVVGGILGALNNWTVATLIEAFPRLRRFGRLFQRHEGSSSDIRAEMYEAGIVGFLDSPLYGWGFDSFRIREAFDNRYSHSNIIEVIYSLGLVGLVIYIGFHLLLLRSVFFARPRRMMFFSLFIIFLLIFNSIDVIYYNVNYLIFLGLMVSLATKQVKS